MPSQPSSASAEPVRLADVFVRLPNEHQQNVLPTASDEQKMDSSEKTSASMRHRNSASKEPVTPKKPMKTFEPHLPPTPDPTPTKNLKRNPTAALLDPQTPSIKRHRTDAAHSPPSRSPHRRFLRTPKFSVVYQPEPSPEEEKEAISWIELKRIAESVMKQVDWEEVAEDVASNRSAWVYKRMVKDVLQEKIEELVGRGEGEK